MSDDLSPTLQALANAIRGREVRPLVALCGCDLWLECFAYRHAKIVDYVAGGKRATGEEDPDILKVGIMTLGNGIVISFDPTLEPDTFILKP